MCRECESGTIELHRLLLDHVPLIVWQADSAGAITFINRCWSECTGATLEEGLGEGWAQWLHPEDRDRVLQDWRRASAADGDFVAEYRLLHHDKSYRNFHVVARGVFAPTGTLLCWVGVCSDVTEVRAREQALHHANRELDAFSSSVSHDLRAPLRSITGFGDRLAQDCAGQLDEQGRHYLDRMRNAAAHMSILIDDLLGLARVSQADTAMASVDLSALALQVIGEFRQQMPDRAIDVVVEENMTATGDAHLLRLALVNLIENALKFSGKRAVSRIEVGAQPPAGELTTFFVRDNGAGFDPAYAGKIFGIFQRLHSHEEFPGTGIGLATVQRIIQKHGGSISAEGAVNQGATFRFTLRRQQDLTA